MESAEQRALGGAAADRLEMRHGLAQEARGLGMVAFRMRGQPVGSRHRAIGPRLAFERLGALGAVLEAGQHFGDRALLAGTGEGVEVLQVEERYEMLMQAALEVR